MLEALLCEKNVSACLVHQNEKKSEVNSFCMDCCICLCPHCLISHATDHNTLKIKRYMYQDVLEVKDVNKLFDCTLVQSYTTNNAKVLFLNPRPKPKQPRDLGNNCVVCDRSLQRQFHYCSIFCKVQQMLEFKSSSDNELYNMTKVETSQITCKDDIEGSSGGGMTSVGGGEFLKASSSSTAHVISKNKRTPIVRDTSLSLRELRRKSTPHRSPLF